MMYSIFVSLSVIASYSSCVPFHIEVTDVDATNPESLLSSDIYEGILSFKSFNEVATTYDKFSNELLLT